jgi:predicted nuclease with TOPRIM domain
VAAAQVWTLIALLAGAQFAAFVEMRRLSDRVNDGFGELRKEFGQLRGEFGELRGEFGELRGEFAILRHEVQERLTRDH